MPDLPKRVTIFEEGPREGFQFEKGHIATDQKVRLLDALSLTGLKHIQVASFVSPRRVPGMADADDLVSRIAVQPGVTYSCIWFNERGLDRAQASGRLAISGKIRAYPSVAFLKRNLNRTPEEHVAQAHEEIRLCAERGIAVTEASVTAAFGCNFEGDISLDKVMDSVAWISDLVDQYNLPVEELSLADTMAWATPDAIKRVVGAVQDRYPRYRLSLHLHNTRGMGIANAYAGLEMGIDSFDSSIAGLGGCPFANHKSAAGNVCTEDLVFMCHEMGIETGIDLEALIACGLLAEEVVGHSLPGSVMKGGSLMALRKRLAGTVTA